MPLMQSEHMSLESLKRIPTAIVGMPDSASHMRSRLDNDTSVGRALPNGLLVPVNFVIHCPKDAQRLLRFTAHMRIAGIAFKPVPCYSGTLHNVNSAIHEGLIPQSAKKATRGKTRQGLDRAMLIGIAIAHLRLMKFVAQGGTVVANVFEDDEVVRSDFRTRRDQLLGQLPSGLDLVKLNAMRPAGIKLKFNGTNRFKGEVFQMKKRLSPLMNVWTGNYVITSWGAQKILNVGRHYNTFGRWESFDMFVLDALFGIRRMSHTDGFLGFSVQSNLLSIHCDGTELCYGVHEKQPYPAIGRCSKLRYKGIDPSIAAACRDGLA